MPRCLLSGGGLAGGGFAAGGLATGFVDERLEWHLVIPPSGVPLFGVRAITLVWVMDQSGVGVTELAGIVASSEMIWDPMALAILDNVCNVVGCQRVSSSVGHVWAQ